MTVKGKYSAYRTERAKLSDALAAYRTRANSSRSQRTVGQPKPNTLTLTSPSPAAERSAPFKAARLTMSWGRG